MSTVWFTSDTHFFHALVAGLRGFDSPQDHDEALLTKWNATVRQHDVVWHLGDVSLGRSDTETLTQVDRMHGDIHLVSGNHDPVWPGHKNARKHLRKWMGVFESVQPFAKVKIGGADTLLSHFPYDGDHSPLDRHTQFRLRDEGVPLLHGHIHQPVQKTGTHSVHVGLDAWGFGPVNIDTVAACLKGMT